MSKKSRQYFHEKIVAAPGDTHPSDAIAMQYNFFSVTKLQPVNQTIIKRPRKPKVDKKDPFD